MRTKYYVIASAAWQSPGRAPYNKTHARYFCTCVEKKAHTSKRVSVIACDNVISKAKLCDAIRAFSAFLQNPKTRVRLCTLGFSEPTKNPENPSNSRRFRELDSDFLGELVFYVRSTYVIASAAWQSPGREPHLYLR